MSAVREKLQVMTLAPRRELLRYLETVFPDGLGSTDLSGQPMLADDPALTAFAQLGALRLNARTCVVSLLNRQTQYVIAESTRSQSLRIANLHGCDDGPLFGIVSIPINATLCGWSVAHANKQRDNAEGIDFYGQSEAAGCFVIPDLSKDDRFRDHIVVTGPAALRFYAGVPLISPRTGSGIGSYCILDDRPRAGIEPAEVQAMTDMAAIIMLHLEHARSTLENSRSEKMVRGIGAFVEGDKSIQNWWSRKSAGLGKKIPQARASADYFANASGIGKNSTMGAENLDKDSDVPQSSSIDSEDDARRDVMDQSGFSALNAKARRHRKDQGVYFARAPSTKDRDSSASPSGLKTLVSRASNIIREAAELDGVLFIDARMASLRSGRTVSHAGASRQDDVNGETSPSSNSEDPNRPCRLLGFSANEESDADEVSPATSLSLFPERTLRYMLRRYPQGKILNLEDPASASESERSASSAESDVRNSIATDIKASEGVKISRANETFIMSKTFPGAKSVAFFPLFDTSKERWFSAAFAYTCSSLRELTVEGELSYLAAFGNSLMAEVSRADALKADEAKADFIGAISHELRSPLHGVLGSVEMLKDSALEPLQADLIHNVQVCGTTLLHTVEHLLDFSKMNNLLRPQIAKDSHSSNEGSPAKSLGFHEATLDLGIVCEEVMQTVSSGQNNDDVGSSLEKDAISSSVALVLDIDDPMTTLFQGQPGALKRIISNLVSNGQKYTTAGFVRLSLETRCLVPAEFEDSDGDERTTIHITVRDSGKGISKQYLRDRLYTPFAQEDAHSSGTGLGLSIVRQIVHSLQGAIHIESEKDVGTSVRISLPMKPVLGKVHQTEREEISAVRGLVGNKSVALVGFDSRAGTECQASPPTSWSPSARGVAFLGRSLASFCEVSLGMKVSRFANLEDMNMTPSACLLDLATARIWMGEPSLHNIPAIVVCPTAQSAAYWTKSKARASSSSRLYYAAQPIGPLRLAKIFSTMFTNSAQTLAATNELWPWDRPSPGIALGSRKSDGNSGPLTPAQTNHSLPHVLVVDDNAINLRLLQTFCRKLGLIHASAANGLEALNAYKEAWASSRPFEYILMDINMPIMDGLESTRQIRQFERDQELRHPRSGPGKKLRSGIIALTGLNSASSQADALASGMDMFLTKPVRFAELRGFLVTESAEIAASSSSPPLASPQGLMEDHDDAESSQPGAAQD